MTCKINADTSDGLKIVSDTSGVIEIQDNGTSRITIGDTIDIQGIELILDADADTSIHASTDDQVDFKIGGTDKFSIGAALTTVSNDLTVTEANSNAATTVTVFNADGVSTAGNQSKIHLGCTNSASHGGQIIAEFTGTADANHATDLIFKTTSTGSSMAEKARLNHQGIFMFETTDIAPWNNGSGTAGGTAIGASDIVGLIASARVEGDPLALNYIDGSNGTLVAFYHNGSIIGTISFSGGTVSYNAFTGAHPSRLTDNSSPTILKGTVMQTLDAMCDWYEIHYTGTDEEGNNVAKVKEIVLPDGKSAGDNHTMEINGVSRTGTIVARGNEKHMQCKVSDTEDSTRIYGVFSDYLNGDTTVYNDVNIHAVGTSIIRVASGVTVSAGDLLSSKGDGTAKLQGDDIIRTKTIGKVLSNVKQETYSDGSFTVPCAVYCG